ncbi:MAG: hypothetical protein FIO04_07545, partial [Nitrosopumilales archaeon]|nr:hypothetical protein [Nitrosopumilales archaeon]
MVAFSKSNILLLLVIAAIGTSLSILSYQYSSVTAKDIAEIASQEIRSNARIEAHDLSELLIHDIQSITNNLRTLAATPAIHNNITTLTQVLIDSAQASTKVLTDGYYLLDQNGRLIAWSNSNGSSVGKSKSLDLGSLEYFIVPKKTHSPYYTSVMTSADNIPRLYIAFPIMVPDAKFDKGGSIIVTKTFKG